MTALPALNLLLVRHAESEGNARGVLQGRLDFELTVRGRQQAHRLARWMRAQRVGWDAAYCSPSARAAQTAEILSEQLSLPAAVPDPALYELAAGALEGLDHAAMCQRFPGIDRRPLTTRGDFAEFGGESYEAVNARVEAFRCRVEASHRSSARTVLVVGHGGWLYQFLKQLVCIPVPRIADLRFGNCSVTRVRLRDRRGFDLGEVLWHVPVELMGTDSSDGPGALYP